MAKEKELDQPTLQRLLRYDPDTGAFTWRELSPRCHIVKVGDSAGSLDGHGYVRVRVLGHLHYGKSKHLGDHASAEQAHAAYVAAKRELHPGGTL